MPPAVENASSELYRLTSRMGHAAFLQAMLAATGDYVCILDLQPRILYAGRSITARLGYAAGELTGSPFAALLPTAPEMPLQPPTRLIGKDRVVIETASTLTPLQDSDGHPLGTLLVLTPPPPPALEDMHVQVLEESNHRVRNNLAMICALLDMEMLQAPANERDRLQISLARTRGLALVHNLIQQPEGFIEVGSLARAVVDSARALFGRIDDPVSVASEGAAYLCPQRATNMSLALTEVVVHLIRCSIAEGQSRFPAVTVRALDGDVEVHVAEAPGTADTPCAALSGLSKEILVGLVERSLRGQIRFIDPPAFHAVIRCATDAPATSHCE